jgi:hypothetical protein
MSDKAQTTEETADEFLNNLAFLRDLSVIRLNLQNFTGESIKPAIAKLDALITTIITEISEETE